MFNIQHSNFYIQTVQTNLSLISCTINDNSYINAWYLLQYHRCIKNLKLSSILINFKMSFIRVMVKLNFQHHYFSLQCRTILQKTF